MLKIAFITIWMKIFANGYLHFDGMVALQCETIQQAHPSAIIVLCTDRAKEHLHNRWNTHKVSFRIHLANVLCGEHCIMLRNISQLFIRMKFMARFQINPIRPSEIVYITLLDHTLTHTHIYSNPVTDNNGRDVFAYEQEHTVRANVWYEWRSSVIRRIYILNFRTF